MSTVSNNNNKKRTFVEIYNKGESNPENFNPITLTPPPPPPPPPPSTTNNSSPIPFEPRNSKLLSVNYLNNETFDAKMEIPHNFITYSPKHFKYNTNHNSRSVPVSPRVSPDPNSFPPSESLNDNLLVKKYNDLLREHNQLKQIYSSNENEISQLKHQVDYLNKLLSDKNNSISSNSSTSNSSSSSNSISSIVGNNSFNNHTEQSTSFPSSNISVSNNNNISNADLMKEILFLKQSLFEFNGPVLDSIQRTNSHFNKFEDVMKTFFEYYKYLIESNFVAVDKSFQIISDRVSETENFLSDYFHGINKSNNIKAQQEKSVSSERSNSPSTLSGLSNTSNSNSNSNNNNNNSNNIRDNNHHYSSYNHYNSYINHNRVDNKHSIPRTYDFNRIYYSQ